MKVAKYLFIKKIIIKNMKTDNEIRNVSFKMGMNCIVDNSKSAKHNKVGKTTFLKLIDIVLGQQDRKSIYFDKTTNSDEDNLKEFIKNNDVCVELYLSNRELKETKHILKVELFPKGKRYIDGEELTLKDYKKKLNYIFFGNVENTPTFRLLLNSFIRVPLDEDSFLSTAIGTNRLQDRLVKDYLFNISDVETDSKIVNFQKNKTDVKKYKRMYLKMNDISSKENLENEINNKRHDYYLLDNRLSNIVDASKFKRDLKQEVTMRNKYKKISREIDDIDYRTHLNNITIEKLIESDNKIKSIDNIGELFNEVKEAMPSIDRKFNDLIQFNEMLIENKLGFLESQNKRMKDCKDYLKHELISIDQNDDISLINDSEISQYEDIMNKRDNLISDILTKETHLKNIQKCDDDLSKEYEINDDFYKNSQKSMDDFNIYFEDYSQIICNEKLRLKYNKNLKANALELENIKGSSNGTRKSIMAAFDIAYQKFAEINKKKVPNFIVHDGLESIESRSVSNIISVLNNVEAQYVIGILNEDLELSLNETDLSYEEKEKIKILELSSDNKLFKV